MPTHDALPHLSIVIGAMKAGTTSLFAWLSEHPQVCPSTTKELQFFSDDDRWSRGPAWYRSVFDWDPAVHRTALDASPRYSKLHSRPHTIERLRSFPGEKRFVYLVRDPASRIESHYAHARARGWPEGDGSLRHSVNPELVDVCRYATTARRYVEAFGRDALLIVRFEDMTAEPQETMREVVRFLGIDWAPLPGLGTRHNDAASRVATGSLVRRIRRSQVRSVTRFVPSSVRQAVLRATAEDVSELRLRPEQEEVIGRQLADELRALRDDFGISLEGWRIR